MSAEMRVLFLLNEFGCDPSRLTALLGINPTRTWLEGQVNPRTNILYRTNGWMLESPLTEPRQLAPHVDWLLARLPGNLEGLRQVTAQFSAKVYCSIYMSDDRPVLYLDANALGRLGQLTASLDIDLYVLPGEEAPGRAF